MDVFVEQIITRRADTRATIAKIAILVGTAAVCAACATAALMFFGHPISLLAIAAIVGAIWLGNSIVKGQHVEYEYILTNNTVNKELDIDKIMGRDKRKRMVTLKLSQAEKFGVYAPETAESADTTVSAHDNTYTNMWYLVVKHETHGKVLLLFNPNDDLAAKLNAALPPRAKAKL